MISLEYSEVNCFPSNCGSTCMRVENQKSEVNVNKYTPKRFQMVMYKKAYRNKRNTYPVTINVKEVQNLSCS